MKTLEAYQGLLVIMVTRTDSLTEKQNTHKNTIEAFIDVVC